MESGWDEKKERGENVVRFYNEARFIGAQHDKTLCGICWENMAF
jgi:hypothetical protein